jgi:hypothetical protein
MRKKSILSLLAIAAIALLFACSGDMAENTDSQVKINVLVKDASSGQPLAAVNLRLLPSGQAKATDAGGTAGFGGISAGSHILLIGKEGYASARQTINIQAASLYPREESQEYVLYPLTATITGFLYYTDANGNIKPAEGAEVVFTLSGDGFVNEAIKATAGADGKYTLKNLPAVGDGDYSLQVMEYAKDGARYESLVCNSCGGLISGNTLTGVDGTLEKSIEKPFMLLEYKKTIDSAESIVFTFSEAIDVTKIKLIWDQTVTVSGSTPSDIDYKDNTITIKPLGKWAESFSVSFNALESVKGNKLNNNIQIKVEAPLEDLSKAEVKELSASSVTLSYMSLAWNQVKGATGYRLYAKADKGYEKRYVLLLPEDVSCNGTSCNANISLSDIGSSLMLSESKVEFLVQAYNNAYATPLNGATPLEVQMPSLSDFEGRKVAGLGYSQFDENEYGAVRLSWTLLDGAIKYHIYAKSSKGDGSFHRACTSNNGSNNYYWFYLYEAETESTSNSCFLFYETLGLEEEDSYPFTDGGYMEFYIRAENIGGYLSLPSDTMRVPED